MGGPLVSKSLKLWIKGLEIKHHIRIEANDEKQVNTYGNVTRFVYGNEAQVLEGLELQRGRPDFKDAWQRMSKQAQSHLDNHLDNTPFSELHAMRTLLAAIPSGCNLHLGNSSIIRYASYLGFSRDDITVNSNRGTSGIDGCTSTAVGAAWVNNRLTVLVTGDLAFLYDRNALWHRHIPDNLRIVVINNGGGGIFTLIEGPERFAAQREYFTTPHTRTCRNTAGEAGLNYYFCRSDAGLRKGIARLFDPLSGPGILEIGSDMEGNKRVFKGLFKTIRR
jgi:2-succinyl-5-enolpyruvyl-6-hydroxy-3-cyclohexene-1-carboxylate synthase